MQKFGLVLLGINNEILFKGKVTLLALNDELIIKKSVEFFHDPSPCFIHRSAVMKRLFMEVEDFMEREINNKNYLHKWDNVPDNIKEIFSEYRSVKLLEISL